MWFKKRIIRVPLLRFRKVRVVNFTGKRRKFWLWFSFNGNECVRRRDLHLIDCENPRRVFPVDPLATAPAYYPTNEPLVSSKPVNICRVQKNLQSFKLKCEWRNPARGLTCLKGKTYIIETSNWYSKKQLVFKAMDWCSKHWTGVKKNDLMFKTMSWCSSQPDDVQKKNLRNEKNPNNRQSKKTADN